MGMMIQQYCVKMSAEKFNLSWNEFGANAVNTKRNLVTDTNFTDVTLVSDDRTHIKAHKVILSSCSKFFKRILVESPHEHPLLFLRGIQHADLLALVKFIYLGVTEVAHDDLEQFMKAAEDLEIEGLQQDLSKNTKYDKKETNLTPPYQESMHDLIEDSRYKTNAGKERLPKYDSIYDSAKEHPIDTFDIALLQETDETRNAYDMQNCDPWKNNDGLFNCDECDYGTKNLGHLKRHKSGKHDGVRFECDQCNRSFSTKTNLKTHKQAKHEGRKYCCEHCEYEFTSPSALSHHRAKYHRYE